MQDATYRTQSRQSFALETMSGDNPAAAVPLPPSRKTRRSHLTRRGHRATFAKHKPLLNVNGLKKSGLTPTPLLSADQAIPSADQIVRWMNIDSLQRTKLGGFTTRELLALKSLTVFDTESETPTLANPLHPLVRT